MDKPSVADRVWSEFLSVLDTLPPSTRAVYLLHAVFDANDEDVERLTGVRKRACRRHLDEARRAVRHVARSAIHDLTRDPNR